MNTKKPRTIRVNDPVNVEAARRARINAAWNASHPKLDRRITSAKKLRKAVRRENEQARRQKLIEASV